MMQPGSVGVSKPMGQVLINWTGGQMITAALELRKGDAITPQGLYTHILDEGAISFACHLLWPAL